MKYRLLLPGIFLVALILVIAWKTTADQESSNATESRDNPRFQEYPTEDQIRRSKRAGVRLEKQKTTVADAVRQFGDHWKDPERLAERIRIWEIPTLTELEDSDQVTLINLMSNIGQTNDLPVGLRFEFIRDHSPIKNLENTVDDMILLLPADQVREMSIALKSIPKGKSSLAVYRLFFIRLKKLDLADSVLNALKQDLESDDEIALFQEVFE